MSLSLSKRKSDQSSFHSCVYLYFLLYLFVFVFALSQAASQVGWQGGSVPVVLLGFKEEIRLTPKFGPIKRRSPSSSSSSSPSSVAANHHQQQKAAIICEHIFRFVGSQGQCLFKVLNWSYKLNNPLEICSKIFLENLSNTKRQIQRGCQV